MGNILKKQELEIIDFCVYIFIFCINNILSLLAIIFMKKQHRTIGI